MCLATAFYHMLRPSKPRPVRRYLSLSVILSCFVILLLFFAVPFPTPAPALPQCRNALIFTGARQGSTWFVDSIENCSYSRYVDGDSTRRFADDVFKKTELWKHFGEVALDGVDMTPYDALNYIVSNTSIKIFPSVFWRRRADIQLMVNERRRYNLTVLILRRDVEAAWDSWVRAEASQVWNGAVKSTNVTFDEGLHRYFVESRQRYDIGVEKLLRENGVAYDVFDYDDAKRRRIIVATNNGCVIKNCNFRTAESGIERREGGDDGSAGEDAGDSPL